MARPTDYSEELIDKICERIATSTHGLHKICSQEGMPCVATVFNWLGKEEYKSFLDKYARARTIQAELLADEIIDISDDGKNDTQIIDGQLRVDHDHIQRSKLRVDARKWKASKLYPKQYGEKVDVTSDGKPLNSKTTGITLPDGTIIEI